MPQEYTIAKVSHEAPRVYENKFGTTYYIKTLLEGHPKPVSIGKKKPDALKPGDTVYGDITPSEFPEDSFKSAQKPEYSASSKPTYQPKDDAAIKAMWSIGQAVAWLGGGDDDEIEPLAKKLFAMVARVKADGNQVSVNLSVDTKQPATDDLPPTELYDFVPTDLGDDPVNLDDIPF